MGTIRIVDHAGCPWMLPASELNRNAEPGDSGVRQLDVVEMLDDAEACARVRFLHPGSADQLQMFEVHFEAGRRVDSHAHEEDEIVLVLSGELQLGARTVGAGSSLYIGKRTLYGFSVGSEGVNFLVIRARKDLSNLTKDDVMRGRKRTSPVSEG